MLRPFVKNDPRINRAGRKPGNTVVDRIRAVTIEVGDEKDPESERTRMEKVVRDAWEGAEAGDKDDREFVFRIIGGKRLFDGDPDRSGEEETRRPALSPEQLHQWIVELGYIKVETVGEPRPELSAENKKHD